MSFWRYRPNAIANNHRHTSDQVLSDSGTPATGGSSWTGPITMSMDDLTTIGGSPGIELWDVVPVAEGDILVEAMVIADEDWIDENSDPVTFNIQVGVVGDSNGSFGIALSGTVADYTDTQGSFDYRQVHRHTFQENAVEEPLIVTFDTQIWIEFSAVPVAGSGRLWFNIM